MAVLYSYYIGYRTKFILLYSSVIWHLTETWAHWAGREKPLGQSQLSSLYREWPIPGLTFFIHEVRE